MKFLNLKLITSLLLLLLIASCKTKQSIPIVSQKFSTPESVKEKIRKASGGKLTTNDYIRRFKGIAMEEMKENGIPASITLAQGILESSNGNSKLSSKSNNHFGIKCHKGWTGGKVYHDDDKKGECFRAYSNPTQSYKDHSDFLVGRNRYKNLFELQKYDYKGWAKGLKAAGYATDKKYPNKLISIIEKNGLTKFDKMVLIPSKIGGDRNDYSSSSQKSFYPKKKSYKTYTIKSGDTLYSIARKYSTTVDKLKQLNDLSSNTVSIGEELRIQ